MTAWEFKHLNLTKETLEALNTDCIKCVATFSGYNSPYNIPLYISKELVYTSEHNKRTDSIKYNIYCILSHYNESILCITQVLREKEEFDKPLFN